MKARLVVVAALGVLLVSFGLAPGEETDPCMSAWQGQRLSDNLYNLDLMVKMLEHLKGCEDARLKHLMEANLQWAAANAREAVDHGARLASPHGAVNFLKPVQEAIVYASQHKLEAPPSVPGQKSDAELAQNLEVIDTWLQRNQ